MTAAEQFTQWGACVDVDAGAVIIQVGTEMARLTPHQAQRFAFELAGAYLHAGTAVRTPNGAWAIEKAAAA